MKRFFVFLSVLTSMFGSAPVCVAQIQSSVVSKPVTNVWYQSAGFWVWPVLHDKAQSSVLV